ncbi:Rabenosyn-5, partial [Operophtera brumata]
HLEQPVTEKDGLRLCEHCYDLIELRKQVQDSRNAKSVLMTAYEQMRNVNAMRGRIGKLAEGIDLLSKQIATIPAQPGTRTAKLHNSIRQAAAHYIKVTCRLSLQADFYAPCAARHQDGQAPQLNETSRSPLYQGNLLSLTSSRFLRSLRSPAPGRPSSTTQSDKPQPIEDLLSLGKLPTEAQLEEVRRQRYERAERQIQMERERMERDRQRTESAGPSGEFRSAVRGGPSAAVRTRGEADTDGTGAHGARPTADRERGA